MPSPSNHKVTNQPPPLGNTNAFRSDPLAMQLAAGLDEAVLSDLDQIGKHVTAPEAQDLARLAATHPPKLRTHDRVGNRLDQVEYHPAWHGLMRRSVGYGIGSSVWEDGSRGIGSAHRARALRYFLLSQLEATHLRSLSATSAAFAALMVAPHLAREWGPRLMTRKYDSSHRSPVDKAGLTFGIAVAEKQAGTDISALTSRAETVGNGLFRITGHKWHVAAPMSDAFLVLARTPGGISCFLVPRYLSGNEANGIAIQRLKDNAGARATGVGEFEFNGSIAQMIGRDGEGPRVIREMVTLMRLDASLGAAGAMRACMAEAVHHARHRKVEGGTLIDQPLAARVLGDLAVETAAATALSMRLARAFDESRNDDAEGAFAHAMTPVVKFWTTRVASQVITETMEMSGANAFNAESVIARHHLDGPARTLADGTPNALALDLVALFRSSPERFDAVLDSIAADLGPRAGATLDVLNAAFALAANDEGAARIVTEQLAIAAAAAELTRLGTGALADHFAETRLGGMWRASYGLTDTRFDGRHLLEALYPPAN